MAFNTQVQLQQHCRQGRGRRFMAHDATLVIMRFHAFPAWERTASMEAINQADIGTTEHAPALALHDTCVLHACGKHRNEVAVARMHSMVSLRALQTFLATTVGRLPSGHAFATRTFASSCAHNLHHLHLVHCFHFRQWDGPFALRPKEVCNYTEKSTQ